jgi:hypothetical protein
LTQIKPFLDIVDQRFFSFDSVEEVRFPLEQIEFDIGLGPQIDRFI